MDIGARIETGITRKETCCFCKRRVLPGHTLNVFTCGHVSHVSCKKKPLRERVEARKKARQEGIEEDDLPGLEIFCPLDHGRSIFTDAVTIPPRPPQPIPREAPPHIGFTGRSLCAICCDGRLTYDRVFHECGLIFCRSCFNWLNDGAKCEHCDGDLERSVVLLDMLDPRELEDNLVD